jgi:hypothetical protein
MINTNTIWAKMIIALNAINGLLNGINWSWHWPAEHPMMFINDHHDHAVTWQIQLPINLFMVWLMWLGYEQINKLREECRKAKTN